MQTCITASLKRQRQSEGFPSEDTQEKIIELLLFGAGGEEFSSLLHINMAQAADILFARCVFAKTEIFCLGVESVK